MLTTISHQLAEIAPGIEERKSLFELGNTVCLYSFTISIT